MISSKTAHRVSLICGGLILVLLGYSLSQPPTVPCGDLPKGYPPIIAFELARSVGDLQQLFGQSADACRAALVKQVDAVNWIDVFPFIPLYTAFLGFFFIGMRARNRTVANLGAVLMIVAALADYAENTALFHISAGPDSPAWLPWLEIATAIKWLLLGVGGALGANLLSKRGGFDYALAALCLISLLAPIAAIADPHAYGPFVSNGITVSWLVFLFVDIRESVRRSSPAQSLGD
ncbi:MAG TPA: hypothetical protein VHL34_05360 [Rhizomicrobium sp.]|jgi:hypothetical protein|nr:hypothetical protein [Rhizomicrobium sp.]